MKILLEWNIYKIPVTKIVFNILWKFIIYLLNFIKLVCATGNFLYELSFDEILGHKMIQRGNGTTTKCLANELNIPTFHILDDETLDSVQEVLGQVRDGIP